MTYLEINLTTGNGWGENFKMLDKHGRNLSGKFKDM